MNSKKIIENTVDEEDLSQYFQQTITNGLYCSSLLIIATATLIDNPICIYTAHHCKGAHNCDSLVECLKNHPCNHVVYLPLQSNSSSSKSPHLMLFTKVIPKTDSRLQLKF